MRGCLVGVILATNFVKTVGSKNINHGELTLTLTLILTHSHTHTYRVCLPHKTIFFLRKERRLKTVKVSYCYGNITNVTRRGELSYLAPLGSENISAPYFKQCFFQGGYYPPPKTESNTTPPSPKTEITNILFYILNFASIIKFKM